MAKPKHRRYPSLQPPSRKTIHFALLFIASAIVGLALIRLSQAAVFSVPAEAETSVPAGNAAKVTDTTASGGQAVKFGQSTALPLVAPYIVQALTGGNNIAVVWTASPEHETLQNYEVYRNDTKVATITPGSGTYPQQKNGRTFIDTNVTRGSSYTYKVRGVAKDGRISSFKVATPVTHPATTFGLPNITIDTSAGGSDLNDYLQNDVKPHLETWYPKMADALAYPDYTPIRNITIYVDPAFDGVASVGGADGAPDKIKVGLNWLRNNKSDGLGVFVHEATHVLQKYPNDPPRHYTEGIADWIRDWFTLERMRIPAVDAQVTAGYSETGNMYQWAQTRYSPGLVRKVNIAYHKNTYSDSYFAGLTGGRSAQQLYDEMKQQYYGKVGVLVSVGNKCVEIANGSNTNGAKLQLATCNAATKGQAWSVAYMDAGNYGNTRTRGAFVNGLLGSSKCVDIQSSGTDNGTSVHSWDCNYGNAQAWSLKPDGTLLNPNSNKCLSTVGDNSANGTQLIIRDCARTTGQIWAWPE